MRMTQVVPLGLNRISHPFLEALDCFEHRELVGWVICIEEPGGGGNSGGRPGETKSWKEMLALT